MEFFLFTHFAYTNFNLLMNSFSYYTIVIIEILTIADDTDRSKEGNCRRRYTTYNYSKVFEVTLDLAVPNVLII